MPKKNYSIQNKGKYIKSPLNYIGGKYKLLNQILPLFPENPDTFVDLFSGGCNVSINVNAGRIFCNDNLTYLIDMYKAFQETETSLIFSHIDERIHEFALSLYNDEGYKRLRTKYNTEKNPLDLFVLIAFSFNHQIRFNGNHEFNNPFGKERSSYNKSMKGNLTEFLLKLKSGNFSFSNDCFTDFNFDRLKKDDFVYCDPPYLITTGTYNDGKRGFKGWSDKEELELLDLLLMLDKRGIKFALSNVLEHKGKSNEFLKSWIERNKKFEVHYLNFDYANSNYQTSVRTKKSSIEVLITNY